jgi:hypothetical protein
MKSSFLTVSSFWVAIIDTTKAKNSMVRELEIKEERGSKVKVEFLQKVLDPKECWWISAGGAFYTAVRNNRSGAGNGSSSPEWRANRNFDGIQGPIRKFPLTCNEACFLHLYPGSLNIRISFLG